MSFDLAVRQADAPPTEREAGTRYVWPCEEEPVFKGARGRVAAGAGWRRVRARLQAAFGGAWPGAHDTRGDALVEAALVLPVLLLLAFGVVGVGRVVHAHGAVGAVAREAAVAGAASRAPAEAERRAEARGREVAEGHHLSPAAVDLQVAPGRFDRSPGDVVAVTAGYDVALADLPLLGWARHRVQGRHVVPIDPHRSR
jgi:TadE-like protein